MKRHHTQLRRALRQILASLCGPVSSVLSALAASPVLDEVCVPEGAMLHPRTAPLVRRKARVIPKDDPRARLYALETQGFIPAGGDPYTEQSLASYRSSGFEVSDAA